MAHTEGHDATARRYPILPTTKLLSASIIADEIWSLFRYVDSRKQTHDRYPKGVEKFVPSWISQCHGNKSTEGKIC